MFARVVEERLCECTYALSLMKAVSKNLCECDWFFFFYIANCGSEIIFIVSCYLPSYYSHSDLDFPLVDVI